MKTNLFILLSVAFFACSEGKKSEEKEVSDEAKTEVAMEAIEDHEMVVVIEAYFKLKDALVATDGEASKKAASKMLEKVKDQRPLGNLQESIKAISKTDKVEEQRKHFQMLSELLYAKAKTVENKEFSIYKQYCPMAFNNSGAYWLSKEEQIANPYFGDKMLRCGKVQEKI